MIFSLKLMMKTINIKEKYELFNDYWKPIVAELNNQQVIIAKVKGEFIWHDHKDEDELFNVIKENFVWNFVIKLSRLMKEMIIVPEVLNITSCRRRSMAFTFRASK